MSSSPAPEAGASSRAPRPLSASPGDEEKPEAAATRRSASPPRAPRGRRSTSEDEEEDEPEDEDDDDDDDDEDDDDDDDSDDSGAAAASGKRKKKRRKRTGNRFLDVEAEVDDDDEDLEEEDAELAKEDGFIEADAEDDLGADGRRQLAAENQRLDRMRREKEDRTAEELAAELNERYRRTARTQKSEYSEVPQRMLMPSVHDPGLYSVRCKAGREREIVITMMRKAIARDEAGQSVGVISCFFRDSLPQRIFMEARSSKDVIDACIEVVGVYARSQEQLFLVPIDEMADLLRITKVVQEVKPGGWVRIKRGRNQGDLAQVIDTTENGEIIGVKYLPRLDLTPREEGETFDKLGRKRKKGAAPGTALNDRPPQRFFNYEEVNRSVPNKDRPIRRDGAYIFRGKTYKDGYCEEDMKLSALITEDVNPTLDEITRFTGDASAQDGGGSALASGAANASSGVDLDLLAEATRAKAEVVLRRGDHVEVLDGEQAGIEGTVDTVGAEAVTLKIELSDGDTQMIEVPVRSVRKRFKPGDHIKVIAGKHLDETGLVVKVEDNVTTFLSDLSLEEVTVFSKDIHEAAEVGSGVTTVGGYNLHELVQLDAQTAGVIFKIERGVFLVLDQLGQVRSVRPAQITMKRDTGRSVALDSEAGEFRAGDTMKEIEGDERDGQVLHVYQSMLVWLFNRDLRENGGVFLSRARKLRPKAPRSAGGAPVMDLSKQNPALQAATMGLQAGGGGGALSNMKRQGGRDMLAGKTVAITKGVYKTYRGIIKDTNGNMARVELHTMSKVLTIELSSLVEKDPITGRSRPLMGPGPGAPGAPGSMGAPSPYSTGTNAFGGATPAYGSGARTPAYASGSKTPAYGSGSKTPAYGYNDGGRTPAYGFNDGGRTPAYGAGSRTPAYGGGGDGGRTPAPNYGGATPSHYGSYGSRPNDGGRTPMAPPLSGAAAFREPAYSAPTPYGAPTPGAYPSAPTPAGAPTPGYGAAAPRGAYGAPTPGAPTPGAYAAPTPGGPMSAPTPGAYGAPTPGGMYGAPTPGAMGAPTPGGAMSAPTPAAGGWGGGGVSASRQSAPMQIRIFSDILVSLGPDASGRSFANGEHDGKGGWVTAVNEAAQTAAVTFDDGARLASVPFAYVKPKRPTARGAYCLALAGAHAGSRVVVQSIDGDEIMALNSGTQESVFGSSSMFAIVA